MTKGEARYARAEGIVMKSFGLLWLANGGVELQDREPVVVQKEIWRACGRQNGSPALLKMHTSGAIRDRTRNPKDLRSAALLLAGRRYGFDSSI